MKIEAKLMTIQSKLKAPKSQYNKFGGYNYRSMEDILEAVKPLLLETKTVLTLSDDIALMNSRFYVFATATLHDTESDEKISNSAYARETETKKGMDEAQITGSASTYARKYALNGLFCIDDSKIEAVVDPDSQNNKDSGTEIASLTDKPVEAQKIDKMQAQAIKNRCERLNVNVASVLTGYMVDRFEDLTYKQLDHLNKRLNKAEKDLASKVDNYEHKEGEA